MSNLLGIIGGMFDPPHLGHRAIVEHAAAGDRYSHVVVVVSGVPPHRDAPTAPADARLAMTRAAFADLSWVEVSAIEVTRPQVGYMIDTVEQLSELHPGLQPELVLGADQARRLGSWHRWAELRELVQLRIVTRAGYDPDHLTAELAGISDTPTSIVQMPPVAVSSTQVRELLAQGDLAGARALVPAAVRPLLEQIYVSSGLLGTPARA